MAGSLISNGLRIVSTVTLTRMLSADDYGVIGIITSMAFALELLSDVGIYPFLVRHRESDPVFLDQVWTLRLLRSLALMVLMAAAAWPVAQAIGKPELTAVLAVWSLDFLFSGLYSLSFATAVRERQLWRLTVMEAASAVSSLVFSITLAFILRNYWALVWGSLGGMAVKAILSYAMFPGAKRRFRYDFGRARELWRFSRSIAASSVLTLMISQTDKLVLARLMPLAAYGVYALAANLAMVSVPLASAYANRVLFASYSESARAGRLDRPSDFYPRRRWVTMLFMLASGGLIGGAGLVVAILYDPRYAQVASYLRLLGISSAVYIVAASSEQALIALGRVRWILYNNIARIFWLTLGLVAALTLHDIFYLILAVGTRECAAVVMNWAGLRRAGLFDLRQEVHGFGALGLGVGIGYAVSHGVLALFPHI